jgi:tetratricopeptide (TPR) repeat protein
MEQSQRKPTLAAYECVLRGIKHLRGYGPDDNRRAAEFFQQAIDLDPGYALAHAYRALAEVILHDYGDVPEALSLASTAVELDAEDSRCHWILGAVLSYRGDVGAAERHHRRAIALNPNDANAVAAFGSLLASLGRHDEGIDRIRDAMRLNPYHPEWYWASLGLALYAARRYADGAEALGHVARPEYWGLCFLAACLAQSDRMEEAGAAAAKARQRRPEFSLANLRLPEWKDADAEHIIEGMRKAGLIE